MPARKIFEGDIYPTTKGGDVLVLEYFNDKKILVEFLDDHKFQLTTSTSALLSGLLHNPYSPNFYGVGYIGVGLYNTNPKLPTYKVYKAWISMIERCSNRAKINGNHLLDYLHSSWVNLQVFGAWYCSQKGWDHPKWQVDKDLLGNGDNFYGPETCTLLPGAINTMIKYIHSGPTNESGLPRGVYFHHSCSKFGVSIREYGSKIKPGTVYFTDVNEAALFYKSKKEHLVRMTALEFKETLDEKAFNKLMQYEVNHN